MPLTEQSCFPTPAFYPPWITVMRPDTSGKRAVGVRVQLPTIVTTATPRPGILATIYEVALPVTMVRCYEPVKDPVVEEFLA